MHQRTGRVRMFEARGGREDVGDEPIGRPTSAAARRAAVGVRDDRLEPRLSGLTVALGIAARSLALIGFGADSVIEVFASSAAVWHIRPGTRRIVRSARDSRAAWSPARSRRSAWA